MLLGVAYEADGLLFEKTSRQTREEEGTAGHPVDLAVHQTTRHEPARRVVQVRELVRYLRRQGKFEA